MSLDVKPQVASVSAQDHTHTCPLYGYNVGNQSPVCLGVPGEAPVTGSGQAGASLATEAASPATLGLNLFLSPTSRKEFCCPGIQVNPGALPLTSPNSVNPKLIYETCCVIIENCLTLI